jgi:hypothetical protein
MHDDFAFGVTLNLNIADAFHATDSISTSWFVFYATDYGL